MTGMSSREQDLHERWHSAEYDRRAVSDLLFAAHECALPSPHRDHDIITLEAMLACVVQHSSSEEA